jgi:hypothetical protein
MPRKIHIDNRLNDIVEMTAEGLQAPHEHYGYYDTPAMYAPPMPAYEPPVQPDSFDIPIAPTPQPIMHEPVVEFQPEPEMVSYEPQPMSQELFNLFMQEAIARANFGPLEPLDIHDIAQVNQVLIDHGVEPLSGGFGIPLEEGLKEIELAVFLAQNVPFEMQQKMGPFGPSPMM